MSSCCKATGEFFHGDFMNYFGFHGACLNSPACDALEGYGELFDNSVEPSATPWNLVAALNVFPVIGSIFSGIVMIIQGKNADNNALIGRGVAQIIVGPVITFIDIIATLGRFFSTRPTESYRQD